MFSTVKHSSQMPAHAPEINQPLLPQTDETSTSQQPESKSAIPSGGVLSRAKNSWFFKQIAGNTKLHQAAQKGDLPTLQSLLDDTHIDPGKMNNFGQTPLDCAIENGHPEIVKALLANPNVKPDAADKNMLTPLSYAAKKGHFDLIELLLAKGAHPALPDKDGFTPLGYAVTKGHYKATETMLRNTQIELDLNLKGMDGKTLLHRAVENEHPEIIALLLKQGDRIDPNIPNSEGLTPLALAAQKNKASALQALLKSQKIEVDKADRKGNTPLHHAVEKNHPKIIELLLQDDRIGPNIPNSDDLTPLALAVQKNKTSALQALLESQKIEVNKADRQGNTPLHHAAEKDHPKFIWMLLEQRGRINPNLQNSEGLTPIALAAQKDSSFALRILVKDEGVDVNLPNREGETPFFIAAKVCTTASSIQDKSLDDQGFRILLGYKLTLFSHQYHKTRVDYHRPRNDGMTPLQYLIKTVGDARDRGSELPREVERAAWYVESMMTHKDVHANIPDDDEIFYKALSVLKEKKYSCYALALDSLKQNGKISEITFDKLRRGSR